LETSINFEFCQGQFGTLILSSKSILCPTRVFKFFWHLKNDGLRKAFSTVALRIRRFLATRGIIHSWPDKSKSLYEEALNLRLGEWIRVRLEKDIIASLDHFIQNSGCRFSQVLLRRYTNWFRSERDRRRLV